MRYRLIYFVISFMLLACMSRIVDLQIVKGDEYRKQSQQRLLKTSAIIAPRGEILDRNGKTLVENKTGFSIEIHYIKGQKDEEKNSLILKLCNAARSEGVPVTDSLPISENGDFFTLPEDEIASWKIKREFAPDASSGNVLDYYAGKYEIGNEYSIAQKRTVAGIRYEMERMDFSSNNPFVLASDISERLMTQIKEYNTEYPGVVISTAPVREFARGSTAAHILGRTGKIYKEEYDTLADKNYSMNDIIGKQGIEKSMEDYLRGTDGLSGVEQSIDGSQVRIVESISPEAGNNVILTIDVNVQEAAERALEDVIKYVREISVAEPKNAGHDANCGAIAAVDVNTGEILALASYPSYDPAAFDEEYTKLSTDPNLPMINRALGGTYEPGSTFKMLTAIAALEENVITPSTQIKDEGKYDFWDDFQPECWIYRSKRVTHGMQNVTQALENSCNYFFYDIGRRTGIEKMNEYAKKFGFGEATGVELVNEEHTGRLAGIELREKNDSIWQPGDTLQAAIGQADNMFTPLQMANYLATLVNGGMRYKTHLVKTVRNSKTGEVIYEALPEVLDTVEMRPENYTAVMNGMRDVVELGTASDVFTDFNVTVGGKTGTAEVAQGSDNAIFVGFAPFDNPTIAVCAVIEHGAHGTNAGRIVREVLDVYFNSETVPDYIIEKNVLTR